MRQTVETLLDDLRILSQAYVDRAEEIDNPDWFDEDPAFALAKTYLAEAS